jgi:hypothetical protein
MQENIITITREVLEGAYESKRTSLGHELELRGYDKELSIWILTSFEYDGEFRGNKKMNCSMSK